MPNLTYTTNLTNGTTADASQVMGNFNDARTLINGGLDSVNLTVVTAANLGLTRGATGGRGKSIIVGAENTSATTYTTLTTADLVTVTLPTDGLIAVAYHATWGEAVSGVARAAIFIGANQLAGVAGASTPVLQETSHGNTATQSQPLYSTAYGLQGADATAGWSDVTTGQSIGSNGSGGGPCYVFAAAGTYAVSIKFKVSSNNVTVQNRKLWVWTLGFD